MLSDLRYALRRLRRSPAFTLVAVFSIALGIGANTAIFTLFNAVLLRTLPVPQPERLAMLIVRSSDGLGYGAISNWRYQRLRDRNTSFSGFAAVTLFSTVVVAAGGGTERLQGEAVSGNYFEVLGVHAVIGRLLTPKDDLTPGANPVCVISDALWQRMFGRDPHVAGRAIRLQNREFTILGVEPPSLAHVRTGVAVDVRVPLTMTGAFSRLRIDDVSVQPIGRLKPGISVRRAQEELTALYRQTDEEHPANRFQRSPVVLIEPGARGFTGLIRDFDRPLQLLMVVAGLVLLIACANVANLTMARASARRPEIAVRLALGASRWRIVRQLLTESTLLSICGASAGVILARWADDALIALAPRTGFGTALIVDAPLDWQVLAFTLGVSIVAVVLFGFAPAVQSIRPKSSAPQRLSLPKIMVVAQIGLSLVLAIGAGLFLRSLRNLKAIDPGFDPEHLVMMSVDPASAGYADAASWNFLDAVVERTRAVPGVVAASLARISPLGGAAGVTNFDVPEYHAAPDENPVVWMNGVGPDYFKTLGTPLIAGRDFNDQDGRGGQKTVIINQKTATHFWPHENPLGRHVTIGASDFEIVGIVKDAKYASLRQAAPETAYTALRSYEPLSFTLHVRVAGPTAPVIAALLGEIRALDRNVPVYNVTTMDAQLDNSIALDRLMAALTALFGSLAVVLAAVGLYGVMAYAVEARTREIGIRMAIGADRARVVRHVMSESALLAVIGIGFGFAGALWASRAAASFLYGLSATDPLTYTALAISLGAVAMAAAWIPARRASRVDPMIALRHD